MIDDYLNQSAYRVVKGKHKLYDDTTAATLNLTGSLPSVPFRVAVTLSSVTGHTDVTGTVTVGSETLTFTTATRKTTTTILSALPTITTSGLNCNILVEAITSAGAPILAETLTAIAVRLAAKTSGFYNSAGVWTKTDYLIHCKTAMDVGDVVRYGSTDYVIMARKEAVDLDGTVQFYKYQSDHRHQRL